MDKITLPQKMGGWIYLKGFLMTFIIYSYDPWPIASPLHASSSTALPGHGAVTQQIPL